MTREIVENTLSAGFDQSRRQARAHRLHAQGAGSSGSMRSQTEIRRFLSGRLDPERTAELGAALRNAGIPT